MPTTHRLLSAALLLLLLAIGTCAQAQPSPPTSTDPTTPEVNADPWTDAINLPLINAAFSDADPYTRLPERFRERVRQPVWSLSRRSAGIAVRFSSDATEIHARWRTGPTSMPHIADNAVRGLDLYTLTPKGARYLGTGRTSRGGAHESRLVTGLSAERREFVLYLPLYEHPQSIEIRGNNGSSIDPPRTRWFARPPVVVYGTSIANGACASRPGMAWPSVLSRHLRREVINLGFSGNGKLEQPLDEALCEIDAAAYILDCLPNLGARGVAERTEPFVDSLLAARPNTPIILVENPRYPGMADRPGFARSINEKNAALRAAFESLRRQYPDASIELVTTEDLADEDHDLTADGIHPTDAGMRAHASRLEPALRGVLNPD